MEIINKKHKDLVRRRFVGIPYMKFLPDKRGIYFSSESAIKFSLHAGMYLQFVIDKDVWMFFCNTDKDGFLISQRPGNAVAISCARVVELFTKQTKCGIPSKFRLSKTGNTLNEDALIKIEINKPLE